MFPSDGTLSNFQEQLVHRTFEQLRNEKKQTNLNPALENKLSENKARQVLNPYRDLGKKKFMALVYTKTSFQGNILTLIEQLAFYSRRFGFSWAQNKTLAKKTGLHRNTISRHKKTLLKEGFIEECEVKLGGVIHEGIRFLWHEDYIKNLKQPE